MIRTKEPIQPEFIRTTTPVDVDRVYTLAECKEIMRPKMKKFCHYYCSNGFNKSKAARQAGYSKKHSQTIGSRLSLNVVVKQYIEYVKEDYEVLCGITKAKQIKEYMKIGYASIGKLHNSWTDLKEFHKLVKKDPDLLDAIESKTYREVETKYGMNTEIKITMHPKLTALTRIDKLMDYESAEKLKVEANVTSTVVILPSNGR